MDILVIVLCWLTMGVLLMGLVGEFLLRPKP